MAGATIEIKPDLTELEALISRIEKRIGTPKPALQIIGGIVLRSVRQNFMQGGRPDKWVKSKKPSGRTLIATRRLMMSINRKLNATSVEIGTNTEYAAVHQFGDDRVVSVRAHKRVGVFGDKSRTANIPTHKRKQNMPARPFLMVQDEDWAAINTAMQDYLTKIEGGASD